MYWNVGKYLSALFASSGFGDKAINEAAAYIAETNPGVKGFNRRGLYRMKQFYETYKDDEFMTPLVTQISWINHLRSELPNWYKKCTKLAVPIFMSFLLSQPNAKPERKTPAWRFLIFRYFVLSWLCALFLYVGADVLHGDVAAEAVFAVCGDFEGFAGLHILPFVGAGELHFALAVGKVHYLRVGGAEFVCAGHEDAERALLSVCEPERVADDLSVKVDVGFGFGGDVFKFFDHDEPS